MRRLLDVLREDLRLTGTKEGCGEGECGACAVLVDGTLVDSCLVPGGAGARPRGDHHRGLARTLAAIQQAFAEHGGAQCGICTPGMILAARELLDRVPDPTEADIREGARRATSAAAPGTSASSRASCSAIELSRGRRA